MPIALPRVGTYFALRATEKALALMGLIAEESLISQRLGKLGRKTKVGGD